MTVYYVDDGGSNTSPFDTWAKAAPTLAALQASIAGSTGTGGNVIYVGADSVSSSDGAAVTFTGPTTGGPCYIISATVGTTTYAASATDQILTTGTLTFTGNFSLYGLQIRSGDTMTIGTPSSASAAESFLSAESCYFKPASNRTVNLSTNSSTVQGRYIYKNCTWSAGLDSGAQSSAFISFGFGMVDILGATFVDSSSHRTGPVIACTNNAPGYLRISGADFSALTGVSGIVSNLYSNVDLIDCKTVASPTFVTSTVDAPATVLAVNCGSADHPEHLFYNSYFGSVTSQSAIYRDSGASVQSVPVSWKLVSTSHAYPASPLATPWMYGVISSTGSKTFTVYVTQDAGAGDLTDADVWLEVEYLGTASGARYANANDRCSVSGFFSGAAAQADDTTSTWTGAITATYKQSLGVSSVTVNDAGLYRARVMLAKASTTLYVDPLVTVS